MTTPNNPFSVLQLFLSKFNSSNIAMSGGVATAAAFFLEKESRLEFFLLWFLTVVLLGPVQEISKNLLKRFFAKLEEKLGTKIDNWADCIVDGFGLLIQMLRYRSPVRFVDRYQNFITTFYSEFEVPGSKRDLAFDCELEEVHISFNFSYDDRQKTPIPPTDEHGLSAIWQALTSGGCSGRKYQPIMITGSPGAGKTTLLKYLLLASAGAKRTKATRKFRRLVPILLPLREIAPQILSAPSKNLARLVESQEMIQSLNPASGWFQRQLKRGRCLVLLDGMDEIANEQDQAKIGRWIDQQIRSYANTAFVVTSRPFAERKDVIRGVTTFLEIRPIDFRQAENFIISWYRHYEERKVQNAKNKKDKAATEKKAHRKANELIVRIKQNPYLFQLTSTPLLLIMIINIYESGYELPKSRGALYKEICKVMVERRKMSDEQWGLINLSADQTLSVLQRLAFKLVFKEQLLFSLEDRDIQTLIRQSLNEFPGGDKINVEAFIDYVVDDVGLLTFSDKVGFYEFNHRCIQEYLAASMIKNYRCENLLIERILHEWWSETIRLYAAQSNATRIIEEADKLATSETQSVVAFKLVYDCLAEAMQVDPKLRNRLENALGHHLSSEDPALRSKAAEVKLIKRFENLIPVGRNLEIDPTHIMTCEYQLFIDEQLDSKKGFYQPDHWPQYTFATNAATQAIRGIRPKDATAFCAWLTQKYGKGGFEFRLPTVTEETFFFREKFTQQLPAGGWCTDQNTYRLEGVEPQLGDLWKQNISQHLSLQIHWIEQLREKISQAIEVCQHCQETDIKDFFRILELQPQAKFDSHHTAGLGLDMSVVDNLATALKLVTLIYQRIQKARSEAKGYGISQQRKAILELANWAERHPVLKHYQLGSTFRSFEQKLGLHDHPIRELGFKVAQSILTVRIEFLILAEYQVAARLRDLQTASAMCEQDFNSDLLDMSRCLTIGHKLVADLKTGCLDKKHAPKLLKQLSENDVGLMHLMQSERIGQIEQDFEQSFSRRFATKRNVLDTCAYFLMAASLWYSLARSHPLAKTAQLTKQLSQSQKLSDMSYLDKRNQALKAYILTILLDQQIKGQLSPWGGIRIVRERILD